MNEKLNKNFVQNSIRKRNKRDYLSSLDIKRRTGTRDYIERKFPDKYDNFGRINKQLFIKKTIDEKSDVINENPCENSNKMGEMDLNKNELVNIIESKCDPKSESELIKTLFGIEHFDTSKNKDHSASSLSYSNVKSKRKYRQYMNRPGGFNRPLSPTQ